MPLFDIVHDLLLCAEKRRDWAEYRRIWDAYQGCC